MRAWPALALSAALAGAAPGEGVFDEPFLVRAAEGVIDVEGGNSAPTLADLDGDGRLDLLVGQFHEGRVRVYPNVGTATAPRFEGFRFLEAAGEPLRLPYG